MQYSFGITVGFEMMAKFFELRPQFGMVVNFSVENNCSACFAGGDGLVATLEVDNLEAGCAKRDDLGFKDSLLIRTAMDQSVGGAANALWIGNPVSMGKADNATQTGADLRSDRP